MILGLIVSNGEVKSYIYDFGVKVLIDVLFRRNIKGSVCFGRIFGFYEIIYDVL